MANLKLRERKTFRTEDSCVCCKNLWSVRLCRPNHIKGVPPCCHWACSIWTQLLKGLIISVIPSMACSSSLMPLLLGVIDIKSLSTNEAKLSEPIIKSFCFSADQANTSATRFGSGSGSSADLDLPKSCFDHGTLFPFTHPWLGLDKWHRYHTLRPRTTWPLRSTSSAWTSSPQT